MEERIEMELDIKKDKDIEERTKGQEHRRLPGMAGV